MDLEKHASYAHDGHSRRSVTTQSAASHADVALSGERPVDGLPAVDSTVGYIPPMRGRSLSGAVSHPSVLRMECNPGTEHEQN
jgi:hypothetical protein